MKLIKGADTQSVGRGFHGEVRLDTSVCYDFVVSLRALFNPRTFTRSRRWASEQLDRLGEDVVAKGQFLFHGLDTALGYGAVRLIRQLPVGAGPGELVAAVRGMPAADLAMLMLDSGDADAARLDRFQAALGKKPKPVVDAAVDGLAPGWATRCRRVLRDPGAVQEEFVMVLEAYLTQVFGGHVDDLTKLVADADTSARSLLDVLPAAAGIERLTGGYTLGEDLDLAAVTLAPSVFIHPYVVARIDEDTHEALVVYGVDSDFFDGYDPVPMRHDLVAALKAMSDPNRLALLRMLAERPMYAAELAAQLRLGQPTVHHHVHQLRAAGLLRQERDRTGMKYSLRADATAEILRSLEDWIFGPLDRRS